MRARVCVCTRMCMSVRVMLLTSLCAHTHVCTHTHAHTHMHMHTRTCTHTHTHTHTRTQQIVRKRLKEFKISPEEFLEIRNVRTLLLNQDVYAHALVLSPTLALTLTLTLTPVVGHEVSGGHAHLRDCVSGDWAFADVAVTG